MLSKGGKGLCYVLLYAIGRYSHFVGHFLIGPSIEIAALQYHPSFCRHLAYLGSDCFYSLVY